jgi:hypothetical protein
VKVLEVIVTTRIRDPHRPAGHALTQNDTFKASDGYEFELHPSGLAVTIRGRDHTRFAPIASAVIEEDDNEDDSADEDEVLRVEGDAASSGAAHFRAHTGEA